MNLSGKIRIDAYDPRWPSFYEVERTRIVASLAPWLETIEHIGSTSVPGLAAKPIIDIMPGLRLGSGKDELDSCVQPMIELGYTYIGQYESELPERRFFRRTATDGGDSADSDRQAVNVHLVTVASGFWQRHLKFRDILRGDAQVCCRYEKLKMELAAVHSVVNDYAEAKTDFIREVLERY
ncbi:MAG: GrpB family protein [Candidatus Obscuribacter sp.]|nr:GrpB family protein [Candidatus Obscuribacter sp.]